MRFPKLVAPMAQSMAVEVIADADGIDEDGAPIEGARWSGLGNYQDHITETFGGKQVETEVRAHVYIDGDAFPDLAVIAGGTVRALGETREIVKGQKARNIDGTVNFTKLELK